MITARRAFKMIEAGGGGTVETAWATISESGQDAEFQTLTLYRSAKPAAFTSHTCNDVPFVNFVFDLCDPMAGTHECLVPAGYRAGTALLIKMQDCDPGTGIGEGEEEDPQQAWSGWCVIQANLMRCAQSVPFDPECCPETQLIKMTRYELFWYVGGALTGYDDPC